MIRFKGNLYLGQGAAKEKGRIIRDIRRHKLQLGVYVISLCVNGRDIFDIIPTYMLGKDDYKGRDLTVLALAKGKEEAAEVAAAMLEDACAAAVSGSTDISSEQLRRYFE